jgi:ubiquinone/menaquinone biosynthesis C-methylase UbiE
VRKVESVLQVVLDAVDVRDGTVIDVGCGTGEMARALAEHGARVVGVDSAEMLSRLAVDDRTAGVRLLEGRAEDLPVADGTANVVLCVASLHHVAAARMARAVQETARVLKPGGRALFIEPLVECTYYMITRLAEEETEARRQAHQAIAGAEEAGFEQEREEFFFIERSLEDFRKLVNLFTEVGEQEERAILARAEQITRTLAAGAGCAPAEYRFRSACRMNLLRKPG